MSDADPAAALKRAAAEAALEEVAPGMIVGLGTGSTAAFVIAGLAARVRAGLRVRTVATSMATARLAAAQGVVVADMADQAQIDHAIDGVDEIDAALRAIKGRGGALLREKIVGRAARRMIAVCDVSKRVEKLGAAPVPVEVLPFARTAAAAAIAALGATPVLRRDGGKPWRSDQDGLILDCRFGDLGDPASLAAALQAIPGVLGHGLFVGEIDAAYVAGPAGVARLGAAPV